jgi:hypothetical protein
MTPDEITLVIPRERALFGVAHLVLGGLGIRLNLTIENLEDLQLALETVLERAQEGGDITIALRIEDDELEARVGPMHDGVREELRAELGDAVGLRRILDAVVDRVELEPAAGGDWVKLTKKVEARA